MAVRRRPESDKLLCVAYVVPDAEAMSYQIRGVESPSELIAAFDLLGAQLPAPLTHRDRQFSDLDRRFAEDRSLMLVVEHKGTIVGGALAFRRNDEVTLRIIALVADHRGRGLGRQLVERIEHVATNLGAREIALGADEAVGFYHRLGYRGRSGLRKQLPATSALRHRDSKDRRRALEELRGRREQRTKQGS